MELTEPVKSETVQATTVQATTEATATVSIKEIVSNYLQLKMLLLKTIRMMQQQLAKH